MEFCVEGRSWQLPLQAVTRARMNEDEDEDILERISERMKKRLSHLNSKAFWCFSFLVRSNIAFTFSFSGWLIVFHPLYLFWMEEGNQK